MDRNSFNLYFVFSNALDESKAVVCYIISKDKEELGHRIIDVILLYVLVPYVKKKSDLLTLN